LRLRTAAGGPDGTEQWWTVEKCKQKRVVAQGQILGGTPTVHGVTADETAVCHKVLVVTPRVQDLAYPRPTLTH